MEPHRCLDDSKNIIAALLLDVHKTHGAVFNYSSFLKTLKKVCKRLSTEGEGFLTKALPKLGKALDKSLTGQAPLKASDHGFKPMASSELPMFMGEFFSRVLDPTGSVLPDPCVTCIRVLRTVLYCLYKYERPFTEELAREVVSKFERTEVDLVTSDAVLAAMRVRVLDRRIKREDLSLPERVCRDARKLLYKVFSSFDPSNIMPRHGPGAVATRQKLWEKYHWTNVSDRITEVYPLDAFFFASAGAVCDSYRSFDKIGSLSHPARVCLVPKDSRGPRLISCEPVDFQWVQQGLGRALVRWIERHPLTRWTVHFTDQVPNQKGALLGSINGRYSTLDLNEASDRVSVDLVRLLFPEHLCRYLLACRTTSTILPDGRELPLNKFAPMGSCLCFPVLAMTIWAILAAGISEAEAYENHKDVTFDGFLVYGDDVVVESAKADLAIELLESFGLKVNRDKSCTSGLFRESCGMDAFNGVCVTPVRFRTVWSTEPSPEVYTSWISYANSFWDRSYYNVYRLVVGNLHHVYGKIPDDMMANKSYPSLRWVPEENKPNRWRINHFFQKKEWRIRTVVARKSEHVLDGWSMLLRYFTEGSTDSTESTLTNKWTRAVDLPHAPFSVSSYTHRRASKLAWRWR
jgi:hypothetical protein